VDTQQARERVRAPEGSLDVASSQAVGTVPPPITYSTPGIGGTPYDPVAAQVRLRRVQNTSDTRGADGSMSEQVVRTPDVSPALDPRWRRFDPRSAQPPHT